MKLSANARDDGYDNYLRYKRAGQKVIVIVNGIEQRDVITADPEAGFIVKYKRDSNGQLVLSNNKQYLHKEKIEGVVEYIMPPLDTI